MNRRGRGPFDPNGMMNQWMPGSPWMQQPQQQQQQPIKDHDPRYKPPQTLRDTIDEIIAEQQECVDILEERLTNLRNVADLGRNAPGKGPADEFVSTEKRATARGEVSSLYTLYEAGAGMAPYRAPGRRGPGRFGGMPPFTPPSDEEMKNKHPLQRYQQLEGEIQNLVAMSMTQQWERDPTQKMRDQATAQAAALTDPGKAADDRLAKLLGPADGSGKLPDASQKASMPGIHVPPGSHPGSPAADPLAGQMQMIQQPQIDPQQQFQQFDAMMMQGQGGGS